MGMVGGTDTTTVGANPMIQMMPMMMMAQMLKGGKPSSFFDKR
jgi:hypothetical protein